MIGIDQDQQVGAAHLFPARVDVSVVSSNSDSQALRKAILPGIVGHFLSRGFKPGDVFDLRAANGPAFEKLATMKHRMFAPDTNDMADIFEELLLLVIQFPIQPGQLVVLTVSVVVAFLRVAQFIAAKQHGYAL